MIGVSLLPFGRGAARHTEAAAGEMIATRDLSIAYGRSVVVDRLSIEARTGEVVCVMGRNGAGKTTLLKALIGVLPAYGGAIRLDGREVTKKPSYARARAGMGYVPQGRGIFPYLSVLENLQMGLEPVGRDTGQLEEVFGLFPVLKQMAGRTAGVLSGGQQQQLAIGRALVLEPELLILDEPNEGIQPNIVREIGDIIIRLNREIGLTVLLVEQKLPFARSLGTDFAIMEKGRTVATGTMPELTDEVVRAHLAV